MRNLAIGMTATMLLGAAQGAWAETIITAQDYAVDSDVVLESVVKEIKSAPRDTVEFVGDLAAFVQNEADTTVNGVKTALEGDSPRLKTRQAAELAIENAWTTANDIVFRSYNVSDEIVEQLTQGADIAAGTSADVSAAFQDVEFTEGTSAYLRPEFNKLFVRQTLENVLMIEDVLAEQNNANRELMGHQVEIQTKFVEVNQSTLNELGFNWTFGSKDGGAANLFGDLTLPVNQGIFSEALRNTAAGASTALGSATDAAVNTLTVAKETGSLQWGLLISALEQADDSDVLSAPSIVTRDGSTATIQVGEDRMVPASFEVDNQSTSLYVEHSDWDSALVGVTMEVTPELRDGGLIDLELKPAVKDLVGYDNYQVTPDNAECRVYGDDAADYGFVDGLLDAASFGQNQGSSSVFDVPTLNAQLPYFRIREMETRVTVADGSTVGMGGLIYDKLETYKDKVPVLGSIPVLGRLFRSEGEKTTKRNLMIFVTATQVDINGRKASDLALNK